VELPKVGVVPDGAVAARLLVIQGDVKSAFVFLVVIFIETVVFFTLYFYRFLNFIFLKINLVIALKAGVFGSRLGLFVRVPGLRVLLVLSVLVAGGANFRIGTEA